MASSKRPNGGANFDAEDAALSTAELGSYDAFVMGRVTYEKFVANWGHVAGNPYIDLIKYGTSRFDDTLVRDQLINERS